MIYNVFYLRDADGRPVGLATVSRNITERKRAEEEMRRFAAELQAANEALETSRCAAINLMDDAVEARRLAEEASAELRQNRIDLNRAQAVARMGSWRLDVQRDELLWSDENYRIFGVPKGTPLTYETFLGTVHPEDRDYVDQQWQAALRGEPYDIEHRIVVGDRVKWVRERAELEFDDDGTLLGGFGTTQDITEKKEAEEALRQAKAAAEAANEAKGRFLANISHELRTPMNAILGMIDLALPTADRRDGPGVPADGPRVGRRALGPAGRSARLGADRVGQAGTGIARRSACGAMLELTARVLGVRASEKGVAFRCEVADDVPDVYVGDALRLRQMLFNLAGNAIKFTERGEVADRRPRRVAGRRRARLEFTVRDTGIGISPADQERIFQPFAQADASTTRRFGGTGLGLSISTSLVAMMGGRIWVESELGQGSTFYFTVSLPWAGELLLEPEPEDVLPEVPSARLRLLLVEDNPANQKLAQYILQERGHIVDIAGEGQRAVQLAAANDYDVILMDVQMPGMDGLEATAAIRKRDERRSTALPRADHRHDGPRHGRRPRAVPGGRHGRLSVQADQRPRDDRPGRKLGRTPRESSRFSPGGRPAGCPAAGRAGKDGGSRAGEIDAVLRSTRSSAPPRPASLPESDGAVFNLEDARRRCFNNPAMFQEMVGYFFKECETVFAEMCAAMARCDWKELGRVGHRLKGTVVYLSATHAAEAARRVEQFGECPGDATESEQAVAALEAGVRTPQGRSGRTPPRRRTGGLARIRTM